MLQIGKEEIGKVKDLSAPLHSLTQDMAHHRILNGVQSSGNIVPQCHHFIIIAYLQATNCHSSPSLKFCRNRLNRRQSIYVNGYA
jgi:hypothetical protein